ncbi:universal stress protein [Aliifodinibius sp. S!AR15-10]|uniref:universal stress protein n=1 Tax=Aliifodinibius sp. S!AR15-10 TaxID=2950437 RepID=UPI002857EF31|nr:universal stress protein [Aliifodinibius sp. S!AR15-10]MDR8393244.1 universal stress protein [Aliifodinibius sp. S!AR15-10]
MAQHLSAQQLQISGAAMDIKHILFPTDFSENAENALPFVLEVAKRTGAKITLLHVIETPSYVTHDADSLPKTHSQKAKNMLADVAERIGSDDQHTELQIETMLHNGTVVTEILDASKETDIDLVVMGTKGKTQMDRILFGSIAAHVILGSQVPVLAVPENCHTLTFDPITFATDYRAGDWQALKHTIGWARMFNSDLNVLHVSAARDLQTDIKFRGFRDLVQEKVNNHPIQFDLVIQKQFLSGVADYLTEHPVGMLVLVRYKKNRIEALLQKNHTKELSYYSKVPLLVLPGELD